ncbi:hypothetical protein AB1A96_17740 [Pseudomonas juntendi]|uniref:hypothetical protein n=1 Tax=Pseudomonas juntendi TaxID=2666183 RepID=UPI00345484C2
MKYIYFSYGMTKSASTFMYQLTEKVFEVANIEPLKLPPEIKGNDSAENYIEPLTDEKINNILNWMPENGAVVIKTHGAPCSLAQSLISSGKAFASATLRDPRDISLSMIDHGRRSMMLGIKDFANIKEPSDAIPDIIVQIDRLNSWANQASCLVAPYETLRSSPDHIAKELCKQLKIKENHLEATAAFSDKSKIIQFNSGKENRHKTEMSVEDSQKFLTEFQEFIFYIDTLQINK